MKVATTQICTNSLIQSARPVSDFEDCFSITISSDKSYKIEDIVTLSFSAFKKGWVNFLFRMRDWLVKPFKLKTAKDYKQEFVIQPAAIEKGGNLWAFNVVEKDDKEVLLFIEDSHLAAWLSIYQRTKNSKIIVSAATVVKFNNTLGRCYLFFIKPFHKLVIKKMLKQTAKQLLKLQNKL